MINVPLPPPVHTRARLIRHTPAECVPVLSGVPCPRVTCPQPRPPAVLAVLARCPRAVLAVPAGRAGRARAVLRRDRLVTGLRSAGRLTTYRSISPLLDTADRTLIQIRLSCWDSRQKGYLGIGSDWNGFVGTPL